MGERTTVGGSSSKSEISESISDSELDSSSRFCLDSSARLSARVLDRVSGGMLSRVNLLNRDTGGDMKD